MRIEARVIPVEGVTQVPDIAEAFDHDVADAEARRHRHELLLLNIATTLAVMLVSCAWIAIALD